MLGKGRARQGPHQRMLSLEGFLKVFTPQVHGLVVVVSSDGGGDGVGLFDTMHKWRTGDPVAAEPNHCGRAVRAGRQQLLDGGVAQERAQIAIEGAGRAPPLHMPEDRYPRVLPQAIFQHPSHVLAADRLTVPIAGAFGDDDNAAPASGGPAGL